MKTALLSIALAATLALAGCSGFFVSQGTGGGGGGGSTTSGFFYVLNGLTNQLVGYQVASGKLTALSNASESLSGLTCLAISHNDEYLYVGTTNGIYYFTISSAGALTAGNSGTVISSIVPQSMQVDSTNGWLVVAPQATAAVEAIPLSSTTGSYSGGTVQTTQLSAATPNQLVLSPDNTHIFVALGTNGTDEIPFTAAATDPLGTHLNTPVSYSNNGTIGSATAVAVDPNTKFLYIAETLANSTNSSTNTGGLRVFTISSKANSVTEVSGSPFPSGGIGPTAILPDHTGNYVYVANRTVYGQSSGNITGYSVLSNSTGSTVSLTALANSPYTAGTTTLALAEDNSYSFIMAINEGGSPDLNVYSFDTTNAGALDGIISTSTGTDPTGAFAIAAAQ